MTELIKYVFSTIYNINPRVYLEDALADAAFPYVTFQFPNSLEDYQKEDFILEVDIWDNSPDTTALEALTQSIDNALHRTKYYSSGKLQVCIYRVNRLMLPDPDERIRRRQLRYICKTYL